jgi:hypothetical protein
MWQAVLKHIGHMQILQFSGRAISDDVANHCSIFLYEINLPRLCESSRYNTAAEFPASGFEATSNSKKSLPKLASTM